MLQVKIWRQLPFNGSPLVNYDNHFAFDSPCCLSVRRSSSLAKKVLPVSGCADGRWRALDCLSSRSQNSKSEHDDTKTNPSSCPVVVRKTRPDTMRKCLHPTKPDPLCYSVCSVPLCNPLDIFAPWPRNVAQVDLPSSKNYVNGYFRIIVVFKSYAASLCERRTTTSAATITIVTVTSYQSETRMRFRLMLSLMSAASAAAVTNWILGNI